MDLCLVRDGDYGVCNMVRGHEGVIHSETLDDGTLWAQWRSVTAASEANRAHTYMTPDERKRNG